MESPQTKPTPLDNQKGGAIKIDMGIEMNYGFWPKTISTLFFMLSSIVMTFLVRECYGSPKKQEF